MRASRTRRRMISCIDGFFDLDQGRPFEIQITARLTARSISLAMFDAPQIPLTMEFLVATGGRAPSEGPARCFRTLHRAPAA
jgi:hypothetical protein